MHLTGRIAQASLGDIDTAIFSRAHNKIPRLWVIAADRHIARIFRKNGEHLELLGEAAPTPSVADIKNKTVGRVVSSSGASVHHKYEPHDDARHQQEISFARQLTRWLDDAVNENAFDRLVIIAAPRTLGNLRKLLSKKARSRILAEVNKELTGSSEADLRKELEGIVII